jgi:hypothetical protein
VLTTYDIEQLASRPGEIVVGTRVQTHLEFEEPIEDAKSARSDWFTIETRQNRLSMRANQPAGRTDLMIVAGGQTLLFTVRIDDTLDAPRRYVIGRAEVRAPRVSGASLLPSRQPVTTHEAPETPTTSVAGSGGAGSGDELPPWLAFHAEATYAPNGVLAIHYALANESRHHLAADATRLRLDVIDPVAGAQRLPYTLSRVSAEGLSNRVAPGGVEFGTILIKDAPRAPIQLSWPLVHIGPGSEVTLRRNFHVGFVREIKP